MKDYFELIKVNDLFYGIKEEEIQPMLECMGYKIKTYLKGEYIGSELAENKYIGIVLKGKVNVLIEDLWGNRTSLMSIGNNEIFGETFACSYGEESSVSLEANCDTKVLMIPFHRVMHSCSMVCRFHHRLIENMVNLISEKNKELIRKIDIVSKKTLREKIMAYLSIQAQYNHSNSFEVSMGRVEMAEYLCSDRSALTRELSNMKKDGLIEYNKNSFKLII